MKNNKFVAKTVKSKGWRVWNRKTKRWWGQFFDEYPEELLKELNGKNRPEKVINYCKKSRSK